MSKKFSLFSAFGSIPIVSKVIIIIPIVIVAVALLFKLQQSIPVLNSKVEISPTPTAVQAIAAPSPVPTTIKIDLTGPYSCEYSEKGQAAQAYIKDKNISLQMTQGQGENFLLKGDCYYKWEPHTYTGEKVCGVSTLVNLYQTVSAVGGVDLSSILSMAQSSDANVASISADFVQKTISSCKKEPVKDSVFTLPYGVVFKDSTPAGAAGSSSDETGGLGALGGIGSLLNMFGGK
jgi:hypothetical protein